MGICKLVDYSDSEHDESDVDHFLDETTCVGKRGRKKNLKKDKKCCIVSKNIKPNPCLGKKCQNSCPQKFCESDRIKINEFYWGLASGPRQKDWLLSCIKEKQIGRRRVSSGKRKVTYEYYINIRGQHTQVCQQFLLQTLGISQMTLRHTLLNAKTKSIVRNRKTKKPPHNKCCDFKINVVKQ